MEFNSLEAQFDACSAYIQSQRSKGWVLLDRHYDDGGYFGGNVNRPALQQLIKDITEHQLDVVVVYKIDRISRSLADFTELSKMFANHGVSLVSVTQQIDTSTSMGRMLVNLLMSFAQYEREITSDRIRDKVSASRRRGLWTGGVPPYGYKVEDHRLVPVPKMAEQVVFAFERYELCQSFLQVARDLNTQFGGRLDGKPWNVEHVRKLLTQPEHAGKLRDNKTGEILEGRQEAIVSFELWSRIQKLIDSKRVGKRERKATAHQSLLKGIIKCGYCGCAMVPTYCTNKGKHTFHYYRCDKTHKHQTENCQLKNISASAVELPVMELIQRLVTNEYFLQLLSSDPKEIELIRLMGKNKVQVMQLLTSTERYRLAQAFLRSVSVRKDGLDVVVRGDWFKQLMGRERIAPVKAENEVIEVKGEMENENSAT